MSVRSGSKALSLVKFIGIPSLIDPIIQLETREISELLPLAEQNKIPMLFLGLLRKFRKHPPIEAQLSRYKDRHVKTLDLTALISSLLEESDIRYTFFKTIKPFPYTPSDIDVLLRSKADLTRACQTLEMKGFKPLDTDLYGSTMLSPYHGINVDITTEVAVSSLIYLNKDLLFDHVNQVKIQGFNVLNLKPDADMMVAAAHSLYKEQMYTLSDYYTLALSSQFYTEAFELAESTHATFALEEALRLTYEITVNAFGSDNILIERLKISLQTAKRGMKQPRKGFDLPMKYPLNVLLRGLSKKILEDPTSRKSLPTALKSSLQPRFINKFLKHITRKGY